MPFVCFKIFGFNSTLKICEQKYSNAFKFHARIQKNAFSFALSLGNNSQSGGYCGHVIVSSKTRSNPVYRVDFLSTHHVHSMSRYTRIQCTAIQSAVSWTNRELSLIYLYSELGLSVMGRPVFEAISLIFVTCTFFYPFYGQSCTV